MEIRVLGAHNVESATTGLVSLLVDNVLAVDVGAFTSVLSLEEQGKVRSVLITHSHYDHLRDLAAIALNASFLEKNVRVYSQAVTLDAVSKHIFNGVIYPDFTRIPESNPPVILRPLEPYKTEEVEGYKVLAVPVVHGVSTVGYQVTSADGKSFFYTGDTGPGLSGCWEHISPQLLFIDVTLPDRLEKHAIASSHLTPRLMGLELAEFRKLKGYLPEIMPIHLSPMFEDEIRAELERVSQELGAGMPVAHEGMKLNL